MADFAELESLKNQATLLEKRLVDAYKQRVQILQTELDGLQGDGAQPPLIRSPRTLTFSDAPTTAAPRGPQPTRSLMVLAVMAAHGHRLHRWSAVDVAHIAARAFTPEMMRSLPRPIQQWPRDVQSVAQTIRLATVGSKMIRKLLVVIKQPDKRVYYALPSGNGRKALDAHMKKFPAWLDAARSVR